MTVGARGTWNNPLARAMRSDLGSAIQGGVLSNISRFATLEPNYRVLKGARGHTSHSRTSGKKDFCQSPTLFASWRLPRFRHLHEGINQCASAPLSWKRLEKNVIPKSGTAC
ncbi:hypothetical protein FA13DRAFT_1402480 [Coprinellus micaceus]|uniref:Uncharacterized protein n=1 Tax=Coprinellus micaceus TaxID=71717 RepID=A0A4Y7SPJ1_COPMI|nr:hypothetical protein FA13DRAFT_1402480 [Coprinellus micaceus]